MGYRGKALARKALCLFGEGERECVRKCLLVWFMAKLFYCHILYLQVKKTRCSYDRVRGSKLCGHCAFYKGAPLTLQMVWITLKASVATNVG